MEILPPLPDHAVRCTALCSPKTLPVLTLPCPSPSPPPHCCLCSYRDDDVDLVQSAAILRYLGRKHGLYGAAGGILEAIRIDQLLDGELACAGHAVVRCGMGMRLIPVPWALLLCGNAALRVLLGPGCTQNTPNVRAAKMQDQRGGHPASNANNDALFALRTLQA